jgi:hypothetical protein
MNLYMFRTVSVSIIRSYSLYTQQCYMPYRFVDSFRAAGSGWKVHHQELTTVNSAMVYAIQVFRQLSSRIRMELQFSWIAWSCRRRLYGLLKHWEEHTV